MDIHCQQNDENQEPKGLTPNNLRHVLNLVDEMIETLCSEDNNLPDRSAKVSRVIHDSLSCYREIDDANFFSGTQSKRDVFFKKAPNDVNQ